MNLNQLNQFLAENKPVFGNPPTLAQRQALAAAVEDYVNSLRAEYAEGQPTSAFRHQLSLHEGDTLIAWDTPAHACKVEVQAHPAVEFALAERLLFERSKLA